MSSSSSSLCSICRRVGGHVCTICDNAYTLAELETHLSKNFSVCANEGHQHLFLATTGRGARKATEAAAAIQRCPVARCGMHGTADEVNEHRLRDHAAGDAAGLKTYCGICKKLVASKNYARHRQLHAEQPEQSELRGGATPTVRKRALVASEHGDGVKTVDGSSKRRAGVPGGDGTDDFGAPADGGFDFDGGGAGGRGAGVALRSVVTLVPTVGNPIFDDHFMVIF